MSGETGWVIEKRSAHLGLGVRCGKLAWVTFDEAVRFARRSDAEAMIQVLGLAEKATAVEHGWGS